MLKMMLTSMMLAFQNVRSHLLHTLLSILGVIIGVASLVAILSLIDGMEQYAREQLANTTSVKAIAVTTNMIRKENDIRIRKDDYDFFSYQSYNSLVSNLANIDRHMIQMRSSTEIDYENSMSTVVMYSATDLVRLKEAKLKIGQMINLEDSNSVIINQSFASLLDSTNSELIAKNLTFFNKSFKIAAIIESNVEQSPEVFLSIKAVPKSYIKLNPPQVLLEAKEVEFADSIKKDIKVFLKNSFKNGDRDFQIMANDQRIDQAAKGFQLFRLIMGLIVGISVVVGGIGVMNVLLISITERTSEIGIRKAIGAKKRDIIFQYMAEAVTISAFGSFIGLILGVLATIVAVPIIKSITEIKFNAAFTADTLIIISIVAIMIGLVFGTYPALRASKLDPVEAMRYE